MKPNIVFLDEYTLGGADLTRLHELGRYTGYSTTAPDEVADRCRDAEIVITNKVVMRRQTLAALPGLRIRDASHIYEGYNDLNDFLRDKRSGQAQRQQEKPEAEKRQSQTEQPKKKGKGIRM